MGRRRPGARRGSGHRRGRGKAAVRRSPTLAGTLRVTKPGVATVETAEGSFRVARRGLREAMNGDEVTGLGLSRRGGKKVALVQGVITRAQTTFLGRFELAVLWVPWYRSTRAWAATSSWCLRTRRQPALAWGGDVVVARIAGVPHSQQRAVVNHREPRWLLGRARPQCPNRSSHPMDLPRSSAGRACAGRGYPGRCRGGLEARTWPSRPALPLLHDHRPTDARDFDDAVYAAQLPDGGFELWVHIADVTHYVGWDTPIDNEAKRRTCSAYLVDRVLPMLPERLCNDVCSLRPREDRLAMSVRMELDDQGRLVSAEAMTSAIRSTARLDYDTVDALLAGRVNASALHEDQRDAQTLEEALRVLDRIRGLRERIREERGSIDFDTVEPKVTLDERDIPRV